MSATPKESEWERRQRRNRMRAEHCGKETEPGWKFCPHCGVGA